MHMFKKDFILLLKFYANKVENFIEKNVHIREKRF